MKPLPPHFKHNMGFNNMELIEFNNIDNIIEKNDNILEENKIDNKIKK